MSFTKVLIVLLFAQIVQARRTVRNRNPAMSPQQDESAEGDTLPDEVEKDADFMTKAAQPAKGKEQAEEEPTAFSLGQNTSTSHEKASQPESTVLMEDHSVQNGSAKPHEGYVWDLDIPSLPAVQIWDEEGPQGTLGTGMASKWHDFKEIEDIGFTESQKQLKPPGYKTATLIPSLPDASAPQNLGSGGDSSWLSVGKGKFKKSGRAVHFNKYFQRNAGEWLLFQAGEDENELVEGLNGNGAGMNFLELLLKRWQLPNDASHLARVHGAMKVEVGIGCMAEWYGVLQKPVSDAEAAGLLTASACPAGASSGKRKMVIPMDILDSRTAAAFGAHADQFKYVGDARGKGHADLRTSQKYVGRLSAYTKGMLYVTFHCQEVGGALSIAIGKTAVYLKHNPAAGPTFLQACQS